MAILPHLGVGGHQVVESEVAGPVMERLTPRIQEHVRLIGLIYVAMSAILLLVLLLCGLPLFEAKTHMFSTIATGGFSNKNASIGAFDDPVVDWIATALVAAFGYDPTSAFTAASATIGNVDPGLGLVGPTTHYGGMPDRTRILPKCNMLVGRLECWAVFVLFRPSFWSAR